MKHEHEKMDFRRGCDSHAGNNDDSGGRKGFPGYKRTLGTGGDRSLE